MPRFWIYIGTKIQGPLDVSSLRKVPGFTLLTQVCQEGEQTWRVADEVIEIKSYFLAPPRPNSFVSPNSNAVQVTEMPPELAALPLPDAAKDKTPKLSIVNAVDGDTLELPEVKKAAPTPEAGASPAPAAGGLRILCDICGYKNPRDVAACMKCGSPLKAPGAAPEGQPGAAPLKTPEAPLLESLKLEEAPPPVASTPPPAAEAAPASSMVEIPLTKVLIGVVILTVLSGGGFMGYKTWKKHKAKAAPKPPAASIQKSTPTKASKKPKRQVVHKRHTPAAAVTSRPQAQVDEVPPERVSRQERQPVAERVETTPEPTSYKVLPEAAPVRHRTSAPVDSPYTSKRRADKNIWTAQEQQAIRQAQKWRIYGGQRTVERNADILMQILRDREYTTAFETGKRLRLYNDMDWSAIPKEGPVYEVHLTFSGGREVDGSSKKPLHFAFNADLERGTVEPGGTDQLRSNTLHAFFDESRIPPEDRRPIAKDTEELVLAGQPGASPLAFDAVVRNFARTYGTLALSRVGQAFGLDGVSKKLLHDPQLGGTDAQSEKPAVALPGMGGKSTSKVAPAPGVDSASYKKEMPEASAISYQGDAPRGKANKSRQMSTSGEVDFQMETGRGRERNFLVRAPSKAPANKLWETLTSYDRLRQFVPDMLVSEREGQDGGAIIFHSVCLTRFMFFVFKMNLHLRIMEHPQQKTLEFERIAGEFESFRGAIEIASDPATRQTTLIFRASVVPKGHAMNWVMESMARRLLVAQMDAIRAKAESL